MKTKPILFNTEMVRAILDRRKTQTRRVIKPQPDIKLEDYGNGFAQIAHWKDPSRLLMRMWLNGEGFNDFCPYGQVGDRLWVRETWAINDVIPIEHRTKAPYIYRAELNERGQAKYTGGWKPSIHMPRAASRITLEITGVRVERIQDISEEDAIAEGIPYQGNPADTIGAFSDLWQSVYSNWDVNPWVWVIEFSPLAIADKEESQ